MIMNKFFQRNLNNLKLLGIETQKNFKGFPIWRMASYQNHQSLNYFSKWNGYSSSQPISKNRQLADDFYTQNKFKDAAEYYLKCLDEEMMSPAQSSENLLDLYGKLGECFESQGKFEAAVLNHQKAAELIVNCLLSGYKLLNDRFKWLI